MTAAPLRLAVGILSKSSYAERRAACRATWLRGGGVDASVEWSFIVGDPAALAVRREGDVLTVPFSDEYASLSKKTAAWCGWALAQEPAPDVLFKCDDDTFVVLDRLLAYIRSGDWGEYSGDDLGPAMAAKWGGAAGRGLRGFAAGGGGYLLSRRAAAWVAEGLRDAPPFWNEDILAGRILQDRGVPLRPSRRFVHYKKQGGTPARDNDLITAHYVQPAEMHRLADRWRDS